jgi:transcriptional regulator with XRE-family HTH domain
LPIKKEEDKMTFGQVVAEARKKVGLSQKELAALIKKEDGQPISPQYLNDIEHDRRNPPSGFLIEQFAQALHIPSEVLYYWAGKLPADVRDVEANEQKVVAAYQAFRRELRRN